MVPDGYCLLEIPKGKLILNEESDKLGYFVLGGVFDIILVDISCEDLVVVCLVDYFV